MAAPDRAARHEFGNWQSAHDLPPLNDGAGDERDSVVWREPDNQQPTARKTSGGTRVT
jgi:hypothetical protein